MIKESLMSRGSFAAASALGLCWLLVGPAFAGILSFSITSGTVDSGGLLMTATGTVACPSNEVIEISVTVAQFVRGTTVANAFGFTPLQCNPAGQPWTVTARPLGFPSIPMKLGPASVGAFAFASDPNTGTFEDAQTSARIILKK
jgi:hypothetical protein